MDPTLNPCGFLPRIRFFTDRLLGSLLDDVIIRIDKIATLGNASAFLLLPGPLGAVDCLYVNLVLPFTFLTC